MDAIQYRARSEQSPETRPYLVQTLKRQYVIIDAPGHKEFLKNMVHGRGNAEAALLLIDAAEGCRSNRAATAMPHLLGIRQIAVLVNKMDLRAIRRSDLTINPKKNFGLF